ncbi:HNH endonuclease family protein [Streptomyces griseoviridis]|uniref:HNH endonuclease n=2 Tax=Streptomyces TaxID=1883 RepID=A0A3S9ZIB9_STRGD|nr:MULTISPECIES: HNH endonuclease family protein [Streptomyces]AZS87565.1 HNH endonuclease [Streptomyces griseoviridis]MDH6701849.1 hypothetical protein [Streptomyces sp. MAA16]MDT0471253.1 HNH endonuclease family protein [Streptomyces sp. DSM 41014]QCN85590.1 hypothetical protein DDJ31_11725 [Streptomyces griseoviridis]
MPKFYARRRLSIVAALTGLIASVGLLNGPTASAALPTPVSAATARSYLSQLTVATENRTGYDRDLFPTWITISGTCNTREYVIKRDGDNVVVNSACTATSGSWYSVYDGVTWTAASSLDIDHVVPLAEAWDSGASGWTTAQRQAFANDVTRPQLVPVTASVNRSKGDKDPGEWVPPLTSYRCTYVRAWVQVKYYYDLSVDSAEKSALTSYLASC